MCECVCMCGINVAPYEWVCQCVRMPCVYMHIYLCIYVCTYVCVYVHLCEYVCAPVCTLYMHIYEYAFVCECINKCTYNHVCIVYMHVCFQVCTSTSGCVSVSVWVCECVCMHIWLCVAMHSMFVSVCLVPACVCTCAPVCAFKEPGNSGATAVRGGGRE